MSKELHIFDAKFIKYLKDNGYKFVRLSDTEGNVLVLWNNNTSATLEKRFTEIKNRLNVLPDGVYILEAKFIYAKGQTPDKYYIKKGKIELSEGVPQTYTPASKSKEDMNDKGVTSIDSALSRIEEIAMLLAENMQLKSEVKILELEVSELESDFYAVDNNLEENETTASSWMKDLGTLVPSLADQYFATKKRDQELAEAKLKIDYLKATGGKANRVRKNPSMVKIQVDINNPAELEELYNYLESLSDEVFNHTVAIIEKRQPELIPLIEEEFMQEGEMEEDEEEKEEKE
jgi:hypothetical protein